MASIRDLKKDINSVLGGIIEAVYVVEATEDGPISKEGNAIIDDAIETFDELIVKISDRDVEDRAGHLKNVRMEFEKEAHKLVDRVNALA